MDKQISKNTFSQKLKRAAALILALSLLSVLYAYSFTSTAGKIQNVALDSVTISQVNSGIFEHSLSLKGTLVPARTQILDAIVGGRVEQIFVEQGAFVIRGQPLLKLSNPSLQLDVISRETQIAEQLNAIHNTKMLADHARLDQQKELLDLKNQIAHLSRKIGQTRLLVEADAIAQSQLQELQQELQHFRTLETIIQQRLSQELAVRDAQISQLDQIDEQLRMNLKFVRANLSHLLVKAPMDGYLSELNVELGEAKIEGSRLGQIDIDDDFKVAASIDEFYLNQISINTPASIVHGDKKTAAKLSKVESLVNQGSFRIELNLPAFLNGYSADQMANIRRGQRFQIELALSTDTSDTLLLERGDFFSSTGGHWAFVIAQDGRSAKRRNISLGKNNSHVVEVLAGLTLADRVITSNYAAFDHAQTLNLD